MTAKQIYLILSKEIDERGIKPKQLPINPETLKRFGETGGINLGSLLDITDFLGFKLTLNKKTNEME